MSYNVGESYCDNCGDVPAPYTRESYDVCPTDRGDEVRYHTEHLCSECAEVLA